MGQYIKEAFEFVVLIAAGITFFHGPVEWITFFAWTIALSVGAGIVSLFLLPFVVLLRVLGRMALGGVAAASRAYHSRGLAPVSSYDGLDDRGEIHPHVSNGGR